MTRLMRVIRYCTDRLTLSWMFKLVQPQKLAVLVEADHASDETTRNGISCYHTYLALCLIETQSASQEAFALSSGKSEVYALNMGVHCGNVGDKLF